MEINVKAMKEKEMTTSKMLIPFLGAAVFGIILLAAMVNIDNEHVMALFMISICFLLCVFIFLLLTILIIIGGILKKHKYMKLKTLHINFYKSGLYIVNGKIAQIDMNSAGAFVIKFIDEPSENLILGVSETIRFHTFLHDVCEKDFTDTINQYTKGMRENWTICSEDKYYKNLPKNWKKVFCQTSFERRRKKLVDLWNVYCSEELSHTINFISKRLIGLFLIQDNDRLAILYIMKNDNDKIVAFEGYLPIKNSETSFSNEIPKEILKFYQNINNGFFEFVTHKIGLLSLENVNNSKGNELQMDNENFWKNVDKNLFMLLTTPLDGENTNISYW